MRSRVGVSLLLLATCWCAAPPAASALDLDNPCPDALVVSPGIKLGYTFGPHGGFTYGVELSMLWRTGADLSALLAYGPVLNLTWVHDGPFYARLGAEVVSWFVGAEVGATYVSDRFGSHFGIGVTPWIGFWYVVPYYTYTLVLGGESLHEVGSYFKLPLCFACKSGGGDDFDWDDD